MNDTSATRRQKFSNWFGQKLRAVISFLGWLYLARVSVVGLMILFGLPLGARGVLRTLAIGAFDLRHLPAAFGIGVLLTIAAWAVFITGAMVFAYGAVRSRFDVLPPPNWIVTAWRYLAWAGVLVNLWTIFAATDYDHQWNVMICICLGLLVGMLGIAVIEEVHRKASKTWLGGNLYLFPIGGDPVELQTAGAEAYEAVSGIARHDRAQRRDAGPAAPRAEDPKAAGQKEDGWDWWLRGYREKIDTDGPWRPMPGQVLLFGGAAVFFALYWFFYFLSYDPTNELTALVYLLLLFSTTVLVAGTISFFLDAYRIPFLTVCIVWLVVASQKQDSDHYYRIWKRTDTKSTTRKVLKPAEVLEKAVEADKPIVLVAIAGGGIQSAAWGTRVLTGLEELIPTARGKGYDQNLPSLAGSIQCISGVSGGSTGAMFFVAGYGPGGLPAPRVRQEGNPFGRAQVLNGIVEAAEETSLGQCVWGLTYPDLRRAWLPLFIGNHYLDRADAMERKWATNAAKYMNVNNGCADLATASLAGWQQDVADGIRPATIFNGTLVEAGERICFSTAPLRHRFDGQREFTGDGGLSKGVDDPQLYPRADLRITTAARLSATFPMVSSAARPLVATHSQNAKGMIEPPKAYWGLIPGRNSLLHVVDGGYFENTGLGALAIWLDDGLTELSQKDGAKWPKKVLIIQIEAFPDDEVQTPGQPASQEASERGTLFQAGAPLVALYNVRGVGHTASATRLIAALQQRWRLTEELNKQNVEPPAATATAGALKSIYQTKSTLVPNVRSVPVRRCEISLVRFTIPKVAHDPTDRPFWEPAWADAKSDSPPLSWHLRDVEKKEIENAWKAFRDEEDALRNQHVKESGFKPSAGKDKDKDEDNPGAHPVRRVLKFLESDNGVALTQSPTP
jgi:hypothetical protein